VRPVDRRLTRRRKPKGTTTCRRQREVPKDVYGSVPRDPRDTVEAKLHESQLPALPAMQSDRPNHNA
jgi:hypothetical protein